MNAALYLLTAADFELDGRRVRQNGWLRATNADLEFALGTDIAFDAALLPPGEVTKTLEEPLGLKGVVLDDLAMTGRVYRKNDGLGSTGVEMALAATARFPSLPGLTLAGVMVFEETTPRL